MSIEWTDILTGKTQEIIDCWPKGEETQEIAKRIIRALTPGIEAHIAAEVDARVKGLRRRIMRLEQILNTFLGADEKMQVAIGGNPIYVDAFLAKARAALAMQGEGE